MYYITEKYVCQSDQPDPLNIQTESVPNSNVYMYEVKW
jgi:hypothetical protein